MVAVIFLMVQGAHRLAHRGEEVRCLVVASSYMEGQGVWVVAVDRLMLAKAQTSVHYSLPSSVAVVHTLLVAATGHERAVMLTARRIQFEAS